MPLDLDAIGDRFADRPAAILPSGRLGFAELVERVRTRARDLGSRGVSAGDRVGVVCDQDAETIVSILAVFDLGCALLPIGSATPPAARQRLVATFDAAWVVEDGKPAPVTGGRAPVPAGPVVLALASSGSTGAPKLALVSESQLAVRTDLQVRCHGVESGARSLVIFPLAHAGGMHLLVCSVSQGACLVFPPNAHPRTVVRTCAEHDVTLLPGPATLFELLVRHRRPDWPSLDSLRFARSTAANLRLEVHRGFTESFGIPLRQSYGSSETGTICSNPSGATHEGRLALGAPAEGVEVRVCDEGGASLPDGEVGELVVRSAGVALGYAGASEGGSRIQDGCFFTGDLGERVDGLFYFRGRSKLLINVGGFKVDPLEIEEVLRRHPSVQDAAVVAHATASRDVVKAIVVASEPVAVEALTDFCSRELAPHQVPRLLEFRSALPRNAIGKLQREQL